MSTTFETARPRRENPDSTQQPPNRLPRMPVLSNGITTTQTQSGYDFPGKSQAGLYSWDELMGGPVRRHSYHYPATQALPPPPKPQSPKMPTAAAPSLSYDITSKPLRSSRAFRHLPPRPLRAVHAHRSPPPPLQRLRLPLAQTPDPTHRRPPPAREILRLPLPNGPALPPRAGSSTRAQFPGISAATVKNSYPDARSSSAR